MHVFNYSVIGSEFNVNVNQQCVLNRYLLNRNTHKTKLCIDQLLKILWQEKPNPVIPLGTMVQYSLIQCTWQCNKTLTMEIMRINYIRKCKGYSIVDGKNIAKTTLNKNKVGGFILYVFKFYYKAVVFQTLVCVVLAYK